MQCLDPKTKFRFPNNMKKAKGRQKIPQSLHIYTSMRAATYSYIFGLW